ncbi:MAG: polysaccharide deacetylase family protein [Clostridia bacterium]|nr:polysaccharide deacetylase family protein [Clostridia bacterium]MBQ7075681.1 polysaccharide deacetylase family protein [Clostridia bacterium]
MRKISVFLLIIIVLLQMPVSANGYNVPVLMYHMVEKEEMGLAPGVSVTPERLREHLSALKESGYTTITFTDYYNYITTGKRFPSKSVLITFDDGYTNNYTYLFPILKELDMKATIFVVASSVGQTPGEYPHFSWEQAREMEESGLVDIQSHTYSHCDLTSLTPEQVRYELRMSRYLIEKNLNKKCHYLAYPFGFYNDTVLKISQEAGYILTTQVSNHIAVTYYGNFEPIKRITVDGDWTVHQLFQKIK